MIPYCILVALNSIQTTHMTGIVTLEIYATSYYTQHGVTPVLYSNFNILPASCLATMASI